MERGNDPISPAAAASLLQWWADAGVDILVDESPRDWLRVGSEQASLHSSRAQALLSKVEGSRSAGTDSSGAPLDSVHPERPPQADGRRARDERGGASGAATLPGQLELFRGLLRDDAGLPFASPTARRVCPAGDPTSGLMIMTDMPAAEDCGTGTLISGEVGRLFDRMLAAIGRDRNSVYLASLSCLRSPDGRFTTDAAKECARLALHHVGLASPRALLLFGDACSKALLGLPMAQARGRWHEIITHSGPIRTIVTLSPSYLLAQPSAKALAWADLQLLMKGLDHDSYA